MRHIRIYTNMLILFLTAIFLLTGCGKMHDVTKEEAALNYWDGEDATYIDVSLDYSAYGKWHTDWIDWYMPTFYLDEEQQTEVVGEGTDQTYHLKVPSDIKYLYVKPPTIAVISELEDQSIALNQEFPIKTEYFDIVAANIPQLVNQNHDQDSIKIAVYLISETNQYLKSDIGHLNHSWLFVSLFTDFFTANIIFKKAQYIFRCMTISKFPIRHSTVWNVKTLAEFPAIHPCFFSYCPHFIVIHSSSSVILLRAAC
jgi:hypothetical protein